MLIKAFFDVVGDADVQGTCFVSKYVNEVLIHDGIIGKLCSKARSFDYAALRSG